MAGEIVLATLTVTSTGVVKGIDQAKGALGDGGEALKKFGSSQNALGSNTQFLIGKMFSLKSVLSTVARAFGFAGIVAGVAFALKDLVVGLITGTTWFKNLSGAVTDWWKALTAGEDALDRLARHQEEFSKTTGVKSSILEEIELLKELKKQRDAVTEAFRAIPATPGASWWTPRSQEMLGLAGRAAPTGAEADALKQTLAAVDAKIMEVGTHLRSLGVSAEEIGGILGKTFSAKPVQEFDFSMSVAIAKIQAAEDTLREAKAVFGEPILPPEMVQDLGILEPDAFAVQISKLEQWGQALRNAVGVLSQHQFTMGVRNLIAAFESMGFSADEARQKVRSLGLELEDSAPKPDLWAEWAKALDTTQVKIQALNIVLQGVGNAIVDALVKGHVGIKKVVSDILAQLARLFIVEGLGYLARGIAASTVWGRALFPDGPAPYFAAAKAFFAAGTAAGLGARALGGGGGGGTGGGGSGGGFGGGRGGRASADAGPSGSTVITVIVQGSMFGTDKDTLARDVHKLIRTAQGDGA